MSQPVRNRKVQSIVFLKILREDIVTLFAISSEPLDGYARITHCLMHRFEILL